MKKWGPCLILAAVLRKPLLQFCCLLSAIAPLVANAQPAVPSGLTVTPGDTQAVLKWSDPSDSSITSYQVRRGTGSGPSFNSWSTVPGSGAATTEATVTGLTNGTRYAFEVRALSGGGNGAAARVWATLAVSPAAAVAIADANLRRGIETALGKSAGATITQGDMATLTDLRANDSGISQLSGLEHAVNLSVLRLQDNSITDISALSGLTALTDLWLGLNRISDISPLSTLTNLAFLSVGGNRISDISPVSTLTSLVFLEVGVNRITDISPLSSLTSLAVLAISGNRISDLSVLSNRPLYWLFAGENSISDLSPLGTQTGLNQLWLNGNRIADISALSHMTTLEGLHLQRNQITDISVLSGLVALRDLRLSDNPIEDISPLVGNSGLGRGDQVRLNNNPLSEESIRTHVPALRFRGVTLYCNSMGCELPSNQAPEVTGELSDLSLEVGERAELNVSGYFRDPEFEPLTYLASSSNPSVAAVSGNKRGAVTVAGDAAGIAEITVTAIDSGGLSARLAFNVTVGRVLSFVQGSASAPEGGMARLEVKLSRPMNSAIMANYVLEADSDSSTADADAEDHRGRDGTLTLAVGETEAFIEVPIADDDLIEPAREFLQVRLLAPAAESNWALGLATAAVAVQEGVCDRTPAVRDALRGTRECWAPSARELAERKYLNLGRQGVASLQERDFLGLAGLQRLHLYSNRLAELPAGLFAGLRSLQRLRLDGNQLAELPAGLLAGLQGLSSLRLEGNRLASLPDGLLAHTPALARLGLGANRLSALPEGFFTGLFSLAELDLSGNPGAPFTLTMALVRTDAEDFAPGPARVVARVAEGAPFTLSAGLLTVAGRADLPTDTARIGVGEMVGASMLVSLQEGGAARLSLSGAPEVPSELCGDMQDGQYPCFQGVQTAAGPELLLFKRPPLLAQAIPGQTLQSLGGAVLLDLAQFFAADGDDALSYTAESSNPALAAVGVVGGVLTLAPNDDGVEGLVEVKVTATDEDGLTVESSFLVEVSPEARPFVRGWRQGWLLMDAPGVQRGEEAQ